MIKNKDQYKICEGCKFYSPIVVFSDGREGYLLPMCRIKYPVISPTEQCPCITCIVKSMCSRTCVDFFKYRDRVIEVEYGPK